MSRPDILMSIIKRIIDLADLTDVLSRFQEAASHLYGLAEPLLLQLALHLNPWLAWLELALQSGVPAPTA